MDAEEMMAKRDKVMDALRSAGFEDVEALDFDAPDPLPIAFSDEGELFVLELNVA